MKYIKIPDKASDDLACAITYLNALILDASGDRVALSCGNVTAFRSSSRSKGGEEILIGYMGRDVTLLPVVSRLLRDVGWAKQLSAPSPQGLTFRPVRH
jgi:hypothetical protein